MKNYDFIKGSKVCYILSLAVIILSLFSIVTKGLNLGVDFTGGMVVDIKETSSIDEITTKVLENYKDTIVQSYSGGTMLKISQKDIHNRESDVEHIKNIVKDAGGEVNKVDFVGPQVGEVLIKNGIYAFSLSLVGILLYVWFRFRLDFSLGAILSLIHDIIVVFGFISLFSLNFDLTTIAAILTVVGYSINDTVVVFDRIRENLNLHKTDDIRNIINLSINHTLKRTVYTSISTLLAILPLLFTSIDSLRNFGIIIFVGVIIGTYSSIFIASPIIMYKHNKEKKNEKN